LEWLDLGDEMNALRGCGTKKRGSLHPETSSIQKKMIGVSLSISKACLIKNQTNPFISQPNPLILEKRLRLCLSKLQKLP